MCLMSYANNKGADQPAHPRSLISAFVVHCLDSIIPLDSIAEISIHVNPPGSSGSLPEMQADSRTPGSETEPPGYKKQKKKIFLNNFQTIIFAHMYGNNGHLLLEGN